LIHNEKNLKVVTTPEKLINLSESFLDLNKKIKERFSEILNEREQSFFQHLNKSMGNVPQENQSNNIAPTSDKNQLVVSTKQTNKNIGLNLQEASFIGKKTLRDFSGEEIANEQSENLLFNKFAATAGTQKDLSGITKQKISGTAEMGVYKSKTSANFYLFLNKKTEKAYFLKNKKEYNEQDESMQSNFETEKRSDLENAKEKKPFSQRFETRSNNENNEENLDLNETEQIKDKDPKTGNKGNNLDDEDDDEIDIPDII
jgi:hypothetical protein